MSSPTSRRRSGSANVSHWGRRLVAPPGASPAARSPFPGSSLGAPLAPLASNPPVALGDLIVHLSLRDLSLPKATHEGSEGAQALKAERGRRRRGSPVVAARRSRHYWRLRWRHQGRTPGSGHILPAPVRQLDDPQPLAAFAVAAHHGQALSDEWMPGVFYDDTAEPLRLGTYGPCLCLLDSRWGSTTGA